MRIFAIDPGNVTSSWVLLDADTNPPTLLDYSLDEPNAAMERHFTPFVQVGAVVIEMVRSYGRPVGESIFETCVWIGRFEQMLERSGLPRERLFRPEVVKLLGLPGSGSGDRQVRARLLEIYGGKATALGTKKAPGPLFGVTEDVWAALAVGVAYSRKVAREKARVGT